MSTTRILLGIICLAALCCRTEPSSSALKHHERGAHRYVKRGANCCYQQGAHGCHCEARCPSWRAQRSHPLPGIQAPWPLSVIARSCKALRGVVRRCEARSKAKQSKAICIGICPGDCFVPRNDESRPNILTLAQSQLGIRELTGKNDGPQVEAYLSVTNLPKGHPWCAAFVSWVFKNAGYDEPRTAWSPALFPQKRRTTTPQPADVLGIYSIRLNRIAHAGVVERRQNDWIISIEGNTNTTGSREGDGVYRKWRHIKTIAKFANWLNEN